MPHQWFFWLRRRGLPSGHLADLVRNYLGIAVCYLPVALVVGPGRVLLGMLPVCALVSLLLWIPFAHGTHEGFSTGDPRARSHNYYGRLAYWFSFGLSMHREHHQRPPSRLDRVAPVRGARSGPPPRSAAAGVARSAFRGKLTGSIPLAAPDLACLMAGLADAAARLWARTPLRGVPRPRRSIPSRCDGAPRAPGRRFPSPAAVSVSDATAPPVWIPCPGGVGGAGRPDRAGRTIRVPLIQDFLAPALPSHRGAPAPAVDGGNRRPAAVEPS